MSNLTRDELFPFRADFNDVKADPATDTPAADDRGHHVIPIRILIRKRSGTSPHCFRQSAT